MAVAREETEEALGLTGSRMKGAPSCVSQEAMLALLREDTLGLESEDSVWEAVVLWARCAIFFSSSLPLSRELMAWWCCRNVCGVASPNPLEWTAEEKQAAREEIAPLLEHVHFPAMNPLR